MSDTVSVEIGFDDMSPAERNIAVQELRERILDAADDDVVVVRTKKDSDFTMDAGSVIVLTLQTASMVSVAGGIAAWLRARGSKLRITVEGATVELTGKGAEQADIPRIVSALSKVAKKK